MTLRSTTIDRLRGGHFDVFVIGGGINGAVSAAVLAGRGASVALVDRGDFAGFTSQESSNLVWGGFKYLENYELALVRGLCKSRNRLLDAYPSSIKEIRFLAALDESSPFPAWLAALGTVGYWLIGNTRTKAPRYLSRRATARREPIINTNSVRASVEYSDAYLADNDARFVFSFVRSALDQGAAAANYVELIDASQSKDLWTLSLKDLESGEEFVATASALINAAGPFVDGLNKSWRHRTEHRIVYSKGIHLVVPQLTANERVLAFFDDTQRLFYVIPMGRRSVIGTTDTRVDDPVSFVTQQDRDFLLTQINARLNLDKALTTEDIIAERCGVRPLVVRNDGDDRQDVDWTSLSRKHEIETDITLRLITIFGGKLTDCLNVGEEVADAVERIGVALEGDDERWFGEAPKEARDEFYRQARAMRLDSLRSRPGVEPLTDRLWRRYGRRAFPMLDAIREDPAMGEDIMGSADYLRVELHHTAETEMVTRLDDFLRRRSKISLVVPSEEVRMSPGLREVSEILFGDDASAKLEEYLALHPPRPETGQVLP